MNKLNERLALVANLSVVVGIVFLAAEMRQNTRAIQAQTRDSITEKQMTWLESISTNPELATAWNQGTREGLAAIEQPHQIMYRFAVVESFRVWENSHYQFEQGLFTPDEFQARRALWRRNVTNFVGMRDVWAQERDHFAPDFRAEIDGIVADVEQAR